jgi:uncharacterized membrane protein
MLVAAFRGDNLYDLLLYLHILAAIVGFGAILLNPIYGAKSKALAQAGRPGEAAAVAESNLFVTEIGEKFIYSLPVTGILLILISDDIWGFSETWISLALLLYAIGLTIARTVMVPNAKRMGELLREMEAAGPPQGGPPPQVALIEATGQKLAKFGPVNHLIFATILFLMIFKPGA